ASHDRRSLPQFFLRFQVLLNLIFYLIVQKHAIGVLFTPACTNARISPSNHSVKQASDWIVLGVALLNRITRGRVPDNMGVISHALFSPDPLHFGGEEHKENWPTLSAHLEE